MITDNEIIFSQYSKKPDHEKSNKELLEELQYMRSITTSSRSSRIMLDEMYQFVALLDPQGNLLDVNEPALKGGGMIRNKIQGIPFWDCRWWSISEESRSRCRDAVLRAAKGEFIRYECEIFGKSAGTEAICIDFSLMPLLDEKGEVWLILPEGRNITEKKLGEMEIERKNNELKTLYEKIKELDELKTQFFANVSHELRTPLALIVGPTDRLLQDKTINESVKKDLEIVSRNARGLLKHVNNLLDISRLEAGKMNVNYSMVDIGRTVNMIASCFEVLAREKNLNYSIITPPEDQPLTAAIDSDKIQRVITNLISNAFKFTPSGGSVSCRVEITLPTFQIIVSDSGPGIPEHLHEIIFERFRQVDGSSSRKHGGTGLGLSIVKEFVNLHGGSVYIKNLPGSGAQFTVELPVSPPNLDELLYKQSVSDSNVSQINDKLNQIQQQHNIIEKMNIEKQSDTYNDEKVLEKEIQSNYSSMGSLQTWEVITQTAIEELSNRETFQLEEKNIYNKPIVLVVEDNVEMNRFISELLSKFYFVYTAFDGQEGLEKTKEIRPDMIVTDCMMPRMSGDEMVGEIRNHEEFDNIPILLLTAKADDNLRVKLLSSGVADYVNKPFSSEELLARVVNIMTMKKAKQFLQEELKTASDDLNELVIQLATQKHDLQNLVTELEKERSNLSNANRSKDEFFMNISHELRTPLNGILGWCQVLKFELDTICQQQQQQMPNNSSPHLNLYNFKKGLDTIERCAISQNQMVNDLLDMSMVISGKFKLHSMPFNLSLLIQMSLNDVSLMAEKKKIKLESDFSFNQPPQPQHSSPARGSGGSGNNSGSIKLSPTSSNLLYINGDQSRIQQCIWNLIVNSLKFTPESGHIKVLVSRLDHSTIQRFKFIENGFCLDDNFLRSTTKDWAFISVSDSGRGIEKEFISSVFERYSQAESSTTRAYGGLGIGLSIVHNIISLHGGSVYAYSEGIDKGSQFTILLPVLDDVDIEQFSSTGGKSKRLRSYDEDEMDYGSDDSARITQSPNSSPLSTSSFTMIGNNNHNQFNSNNNNNNSNINSISNFYNLNNFDSMDIQEYESNDKPLKGLNILIVDDMEDTVQLLSTMLYKLGANHVVSFYNVKDVYYYLCNNIQPDIVIADISMPHQDGFTLIHKIRSCNRDPDKEPHHYQFHNLPVIALTAFASDLDKEKIIKAKFNQHLSKPVNFKELTSAILNLTNRSNLQN